MAGEKFKYIIVGGGLAGASAIDGIREYDKDSKIALLGSENKLPYHRPPLTKGLWTGVKTIPSIFVNSSSYYEKQNVHLELDSTVSEIDKEQHIVYTGNGKEFTYEKLLLATGGTPKRLPIPGADLEGICYFRYLSDFESIRPQISAKTSVVVIGGGFIGSEIAASVSRIGGAVTVVFPEEYLCARVFPQGLGSSLTEKYRERGINIEAGTKPVSFTRNNSDKYIISLENGKEYKADVLIVGIGIRPDMDLAQQAGLQVENGIVVNDYLQTSNLDIYAAGDVAQFPYIVLEKSMRVEHWDNAFNQGKHAGMAMAGGKNSYTYMPYFFSDLFEFGYEAVGDVNAQMKTIAFWKEKYTTGIIYYVDNSNTVRGVMLCNVWEKTDMAKECIRKKMEVTEANVDEIIPVG